MKKMLFAVVVSLTTMGSTFAAICSCDAPPECGRRPSSCYKPRPKNPLYSVRITSNETFDVLEKQSIGQAVVVTSYEGSSEEIEKTLGELFYNNESY